MSDYPPPYPPYPPYYGYAPPQAANPQPEPEPAPTAETASPEQPTEQAPEPAPQMEGEFEVFDFGGQKRYKCNQNWSTGSRCHYDTHDYGALMAHLSATHGYGVQPVKRTVVSPVLGPDGQPITSEVEARFKEE